MKTKDEILVDMFKQGEPFYNEKDIKWAMELYAKNRYSLGYSDGYDEATTQAIREIDNNYKPK